MFDYIRMPFPFNPLVDISTPWDSAEDGKKLIEAAGKVDFEPLKLVEWSEMSSDFAIKRFVFSGISAIDLCGVKGGEKTIDGVGISYKVDWNWLGLFPVRAGFERYGAILYLDAKGDPAQIYWTHADKNVTAASSKTEWAHAKWVFKCSVLVGTTLRDHLVGVHFM